MLDDYMIITMVGKPHQCATSMSNSFCGFQLNTNYIEPQFHGLVLYIGVGTFLIFYTHSLKGHKVK